MERKIKKKNVKMAVDGDKKVRTESNLNVYFVSSPRALPNPRRSKKLLKY